MRCAWNALRPPCRSRRAARPADFVRPLGVDLPSLAESVRSVEERIARQNAEYEALTRSYERACERPRHLTRAGA